MLLEVPDAGIKVEKVELGASRGQKAVRGEPLKVLAQKPGATKNQERASTHIVGRTDSPAGKPCATGGTA